MNTRDIVVLKFGGSVLTDENAVAGAVHEIYRHLREGARVVAVVSAVGRTTDALIEKAKRYCEEPDPVGLAALLATGEATSAALLSLGLARSGIPSVVFDAPRAGLRTEGPLLDASPVDLDRGALLKALGSWPVVVLPGFVGVSAEGCTSLLGRGGSDLTALYAAWTLQARTCRLVKDVNGFYEWDPAARAERPRRFARISWQDALSLESDLVQPKALRFARDRGLEFEVGALQSATSTEVGAGPSRFDEDDRKARPLRVLLLGLGTVGLGVYKRLAAQHDRFEVVGALVRDPGRDRGDDVPPELLFTDPWDVLTLGCDVVIETLGGTDPAAAVLGTALDLGLDVVTANKEVVALFGPDLEARARRSGAAFLYSACVGGAVPVVEKLMELARGDRIRSVEGVVNGTTNFILDRLVEGCGFQEAVLEAQRRGFAEADPSADLEGTDAAWKLSILAGLAIQDYVAPAAVHRTGIDGIDPETVRREEARGRVVRLVASCRRTTLGVELVVAPRFLDRDHPLAQARGEGNRVVIETESGRVAVLDGKGAGRWPTAESAVADVLAIWRDRRVAAGRRALLV